MLFWTQLVTPTQSARNLCLLQSNFVSLLDLFQKDYQTAVHRAILDSFARSDGQTSDPIIINTAFSSAKSARSPPGSSSYH